MKLTKVLSLLGSMIVGLGLVLAIVAARPSLATDTVAAADLPPVEDAPNLEAFDATPPPAVQEASEGAALRDVLVEFDLARGQGPEAVLAFAESLDSETLALLQPEIDQRISPSSADAVEATPYVGINNGGCTYISLQTAIDAAKQDDIIKVTAGTHLDMPDIFSKQLTIEGGYNADCLTHSGGTTTLDGDGTQSVIDFSDSIVTLRDFIITDGGGSGLDTLGNAHITLHNTDITQNNGPLGGGVYIDSYSSLTLTNDSDIYQNTASSFGGGVYVLGHFNAMDDDSDIYQNSAPHGGGIYANGAEVYLSAADVAQNEATSAVGKGGGIYMLNGSTLTTKKGVFFHRGNIAYNGGAIYADHSTVTLQGTTTFLQNTASNYGGAIYLTNDSLLSGVGQIGQAGATTANEAVRGAGIYAITSTVELQGQIVNNIADKYGAGLYAEASTINLTDMQVGGVLDYETNVLMANNASGAGLFLSSGTNATLLNTSIISNSFQGSSMTYGGGIFLGYNSEMTMTNSSIEQNNASGYYGIGAGLYVNIASATLSNTTVLSNTANWMAGGIRVYDGVALNIEGGSEFRNNKAIIENGGAIAVDSATPDINIANTDFILNGAGTSGGAIYLGSGTLDFTGGWTLLGNSSAISGGAVMVTGTADADFTADSYSMISNNVAYAGIGGAVFVGNQATVDIRAAESTSLYIYANNAYGDGGFAGGDAGALFRLYGELNIDHNNAYYGDGGAFYLTNGSILQLNEVSGTGQLFRDNTAENGGAIYANGATVDCEGAEFGMENYPNEATAGGGGAIRMVGGTLDLTNCSFHHNTSMADGGAIDAALSTVTVAPDYTQCDALTEECSTFYANTADSDVNDAGNGGALNVHSCNLTVSQTYFHENSATDGGAIFQNGAFADTTMANVLVYNNTVNVGSGAGIRSEDGIIVLRNTTLANNIGGDGYSQQNTDGTITQSIAWGNASGGFWATSGTMTGDCNIDQSENVGINEDPLYVDAPMGDFHLDKHSPAVDVCSTGLDVDLDGNSRPIGAGYDMGAYERTWDYINLLPISLKDS